MTPKYTPCCFTLGFHFREVHSRSFRELKIFALVDHDFIVVVLLKSLDERVSGFDELFVFCRSSCNLTSCFRIYCLSITAQKNLITIFITCNKSNASTLCNLEHPPGFAQCAGHELVSE